MTRRASIIANADIAAEPRSRSAQLRTKQSPSNPLIEWASFTIHDGARRRRLRNLPTITARAGERPATHWAYQSAGTACPIEARTAHARESLQPERLPKAARLRRLASASSQGTAIMIAEASSRDAMLAAIPRLRAFAISLCRNGDQADDLVQEALLRACANIASFKPGTSMLAWLFTILRNHFYSECRRRRRLFESIDDKADNLASKPMQVAQTEHHELCAALTKLPPEQRMAIMLIGASGLSYDEAAKVCGCPTGTMKSRVNRARAELAQLMSIEGSEYFEEDPIISAVMVKGDRLATGA